jgi:hypothetical protein
MSIEGSQPFSESDVTLTTLGALPGVAIVGVESKFIVANTTTRQAAGQRINRCIGEK